MRILLVEDDQRLADLVARRLRGEGHSVETRANGVDGLEAAASGTSDLAVVDVMLPGLDGKALTRQLRERGIGLPVLMLTARDTVDDRVSGLRSGADDYLVKPFAFAELLARIDALARRTELHTTRQVLAVGALTLDPRSRRARLHGDELELTATEFDLLECLLRNAGRVLTRSELRRSVWGYTFEAQTKIVDLYVHYLRRKLGDDADMIRTVRGVGYALGR
jgi:two-component system, OmpR family, response regulator